jgi:putative ABC transport system permease protein
MDKYMGEFTGKAALKWGLTINPLTGIYFEEATPFDNVKHGNKKMVYIFMCIAFLILVIACINFCKPGNSPGQ